MQFLWTYLIMHAFFFANNNLKVTVYLFIYQKQNSDHLNWSLYTKLLNFFLIIITYECIFY